MTQKSFICTAAGNKLGINTNLNEANKLRKELVECHLKDASGIEIRITIPNPDDSKYEGCALKISKTKLEGTSFRVLEDFCRKHKLTMKKRNGYWILYTPKRL
jgi:hypothetical protein